MAMEWVRGRLIGSGRFGTVSLAIPTYTSSQFSLMAVKSCDLSLSKSLKTEKEVLSCIGDCPEIVGFYGDSVTIEKGVKFYNLLLEYACNGSLSDQVRISGGKLGFSDVKTYTSSILRGLCHVHEKGFAHCDIKLDNVLVFEDGAAKIADFGLAKRVAEKNKMNEFRGTPLYMAPELVVSGDGGPPADIWALGCAVVEMISGKPAWKCSPGLDINAIIFRIGMGKESPEIPQELSSEGKEFLGKCFIRDPNERWTARMLLDHPFVSGFDHTTPPEIPRTTEYRARFDHDEDEKLSVSPRCPFDLSYWDSPELLTPVPIKVFEESKIEYGDFDFKEWHSGRLDMFVGDGCVPDWGDSDGWVNVR